MEVGERIKGFFPIFFNIKVFSRYFLTIDIGLPIIGAFLPESPEFFIPPTFSYIDDIIIFADFSVNVEPTYFFSSLF